jgi:hypothetical protein
MNPLQYHDNYERKYTVGKVEQLTTENKQTFIPTAIQPKKLKLTFVTDECSDWQALYVDGEKFEEGHQITVKDMIDLMKKYNLVESLEYKTINNQKYDGEESFPEFYSNLSDYAEDDFE